MNFKENSCNTCSRNKADRILCSENYASFLKNTVECIWMFDLKNQCFQYVSPSIYNLRGLTVEEAMKESLEDSLAPQSLQKMKLHMLKRYPRFLTGDRSEEVVCDIDEYDQYCKDGSVKTIEISTRLVFNEETQGVDVIGISRDITKRKQFEKELIQKLRELTNIIENHESCVFENTSTLRIYSFKKFVVYGTTHQNAINWRTSKTEELFAFLTYKNPSPISKYEIIENLWPDISPKKATTYLHTTLYNMKKDLEAAGISLPIKFSNGYYTYQFPSYYSDVLEFEHIIENTILTFGRVDEHSDIDYERALFLYKGDYLCEDGYLWSLSKSSTLHKQFEAAAHALSRYYFLTYNYTSTKKVLMKLLENDNLNESVHELLLKVYLQENDYISFKNHYAHMENLLLTELGISPKVSIQNLYKNVNSLNPKNINSETSPFHAR